MSLANCDAQKNLLCDILEAQDLDKNGKVLEAVRKYLTCLKSLSDRVLVCTYSTGLQMPETSLEHVKLCVMLSERIQDIFLKQETRESMHQRNIREHSSGSSPVEEALKLNQSLMKAHKERISKFFVGNSHHSLNMNLMLQRKMSENIVIAERHRINLEKKRQEKMQQIIEETEKKFLNNSYLTEFEIHQKKIYSDVLKFELNNDSWETLRTADKKCLDEKFIINLIEQILNTKSHPLHTYLQGEQFKVCFKIKEVLDKAKIEHGICHCGICPETFKEEVMTFVKRSYSEVIKMFIFLYEQLDDVDKKSVLHSCLEQHFYGSFWEFLKDLYRLHLGSFVEHLESLMDFCKTVKFSPENVGVSENFQLLQEKIPYEEAIKNFTSISKCQPLSPKLNRLSEAFHSICNCVKQYKSSNKNELMELGADELLPILSYCLLSSNTSSLFTECHILMDLTDDSQLMGESGYCLASVLTALDWLSRTDVNDIKTHSNSDN